MEFLGELLGEKERDVVRREDSNRFASSSLLDCSQVEFSRRKVKARNSASGRKDDDDASPSFLSIFLEASITFSNLTRASSEDKGEADGDEARARLACLARAKDASGVDDAALLDVLVCPLSWMALSPLAVLILSFEDGCGRRRTFSTIERRSAVSLIPWSFPMVHIIILCHVIWQKKKDRAALSTYNTVPMKNVFYHPLLYNVLGCTRPQSSLSQCLLFSPAIP